MKRLALIGAKGMLAQMVSKVAPPNYELIALDLPEFDLTDRQQVLAVLGEWRPQVILNCAAFTNVDGCETQQELANQVNGTGVGYLAAAAKELGATLVHISTDYVFDGKKGQPYREDDAPNPQSAYGRSKLLGEEEIARSGLERFFILRTSWLYGPGGNNFVETMIRLAREREELRVVADQVGSPTFTRDLATAIFRLLAVETPAKHYGIYHVANSGECSWHEFAQEIVLLAQKAGEPVKAQRVLPIKTEDYPLPAPRPAYSVFSKEKYTQVTGQQLPDWRDSLSSYIDSRD